MSDGAGRKIFETRPSVLTVCQTVRMTTTDRAPSRKSRPGDGRRITDQGRTAGAAAAGLATSDVVWTLMLGPCLSFCAQRPVAALAVIPSGARNQGTQGPNPIPRSA